MTCNVKLSNAADEPPVLSTMSQLYSMPGAALVARYPELTLEPSEQRTIEGLVCELSGQPTIDDSLLDELALRSHRVPGRISLFFRRQSTGAGPGYWVIRKAVAKDIIDCPTPKQHASAKPPTQPDLTLIMLSTLLGEIFGWATQQAGQLVHDIIPVLGKEQDLTSASSQRELSWHTEDAFHPFRADYVGLMCLRNASRTSTTVAALADVPLTQNELEILMQPRYLIVPDASHAVPASPAESTGQDPLAVTTNPATAYTTAVVFGDPEKPFIRCDPDFTTVADPLDIDAAQALDKLTSSLNDVLADVVLAPGDLIFIDNYRVVHGRRPFQPSNDDHDRWLKRINITRDLRKMAALGVSYSQRIVPL